MTVDLCLFTINSIFLFVSESFEVRVEHLSVDDRLPVSNDDINEANGALLKASVRKRDCEPRPVGGARRHIFL